MKPVQEIILRTQCGWVVDPTVDGFVVRIRDIASLPKIERNEYGQRGRNAVLTEMNWEVDGQKLYEALRKLLFKT